MAIEKDWTIMIYMAGDNNLSADMAYALADIREVMKDRGDKLNLMVYYDGAAIGSPTLYCDFTDFDKPIYCPSYLVEKAFTSKKRKKDNSNNAEDDRRKKNASNPDENSGAAYSLMNFINWCVNETIVSSYENNQTIKKINRGKRAKKYALIFSGHASAFQNFSLMVDTASNYYMTIPKLRWALEEITKKDAPFERDVPLLQQKIDLLGFDSCLMGMAELAFEFSGAAKTLVASEGNMPSAGWSYGNILSKLISPDTNTSVMDEKIVAQGFVEEFIERQNSFLIGGVSADLAAIDLSEEKIDPVIKCLNAFGKSLYEARCFMDSGLDEKLENAVRLAHLDCQSYMYEQNVDLKDFCEILLVYISEYKDQLSDLVGACNNLIQAIDECVLMCGFSGGAYQYSNGISAYFPWTIYSYKNSKENYKKLRVFDDKNSLLEYWDKFLDAFTYNTHRGARTEIGKEHKFGDKIGYNVFVPTKPNGIANNRTIVRNQFDGSVYDNVKDTHVGNDKDTHIGNDKDTHVGNDKDTHVGNDKDTHVGNDKDTHVGNDKDTHVGNDKDTHVGNDKDTHVGNDKDTHVGNDKDTHIGNDKDTHIGNDKGLQQFLKAQIKNVASRWNMAGFTKFPNSRKPEIAPDDANK